MHKPEKFEIVYVKHRGRLVPATAMDEEEFARLAEGTTVKIVPDDTRGHDQLAFYWFVLLAVVRATGRWPTKDHLHDAAKRALGYMHVARGLDGLPWLALDSIALGAMLDADRAEYMQQAFAVIGEAIGVDPVSLVDQPQRRAA